MESAFGLVKWHSCGSTWPHCRRVVQFYTLIYWFRLVNLHYGYPAAMLSVAKYKHWHTVTFGVYGHITGYTCSDAIQNKHGL